MQQIKRLLVVAIGIAIALAGLGMGTWLPGASPGIHPPQLLLVAAGLALALLAARRRGGKYDSQQEAGILKRLATVSIIALTTLIALEIALSAGGFSTYFPPGPAGNELSVVPWWVCGEAGCHYDYDSIQPACESGELEGRVCTINRQGYPDSADFVLPDDQRERSRILLLGDSVTWGMRADLGASYAETLSSALPDAIIWNTGIPGTGTNQARMVFDVYAPLLQPQLTVLGFVSNDFDDNLLPVDSWINARDASGRAMHLRRYAIDAEENVIAFDLGDLGYIQAHRKSPPRSALEARLGSTRLGSLLLQLRDTLKSTWSADEPFARRRQVTRQYLQNLKASINASGSGFLVVLIPEPEDIRSPSARYQIAEALMRELEIAFLNPVSILDPVADYAQPPDLHWNNAGHRKIGDLLSACVGRFFASGEFSECAHVTLP